MGPNHALCHAVIELIEYFCGSASNFETGALAMLTALQPFTFPSVSPLVCEDSEALSMIVIPGTLVPTSILIDGSSFTKCSLVSFQRFTLVDIWLLIVHESLLD